MTNEERDLITQFIMRVGGNPAQATGSFSGSVPATQAQMPPIDREADGLIGELLGRYPEARYRLTQLAVVQEQALGQAQNRINQLQSELQQARQAPAASQGGASPWGNAAPQQPQQAPQSRGLFGGLFGGGAAPRQPQYQQPQYAPQQQQFAPPGGGMFQRGGSGFLGSALTTAAGVAGGMVAGNALMNMFSGHHDSSTFGGGFGGDGGGFGQSGYGGDQGGFAGGVDPYDVGGASKDAPMQDGGGFTDNSGWSTPDQGAADPGWTDSSGGGGGDWTDTSGGGSDSI